MAAELLKTFGLFAAWMVNCDSWQKDVYVRASFGVRDEAQRSVEEIVCFSEYMFEGNWTYGAPGEWLPAKTCSRGTAQSPVDLPREGSIKARFGTIELHRYTAWPKYLRLTNTGKTVMLDFGTLLPVSASKRLTGAKNGERQVLIECCQLEEGRDADWPRISDGGLSGTFLFHQVHFHWGKSDSHGSEHSKSGTFYPLEVQIFHYNAKYKSMLEAMTKDDGIAALATFFQLSMDVNHNINDLIGYLRHVTKANSQVLVYEPFPLFHLLPKHKGQFFRYNGSMSAPPCTENVQWTVFKNPLKISLKQLSSFRQLLGDHVKLSGSSHELRHPNLWDNWRPPRTGVERRSLQLFENTDVEVEAAQLLPNATAAAGNNASRRAHAAFLILLPSYRSF